MSVTINGTGGLTFNDGSNQNTASKVGMVNRIINGAMRIDQRNAGASQSVSASTYPYTVDRFWIACGGTSAAFTVQQNQGSVTPPTGFTNYVGITVATSKSPASGDEFTYEQPIEGNNIADLGFGTAGANTVTLSFWIRSSLTGTFSGYLLNSARNRSYIFNYAISAANTWEYKTVTIVGDTTGTWLTTTGAGFRLGFDLGSGSNFNTTGNAWGTADARRTSGSVQLIANSAATFYITGVQLEKGSTATSFDYRPYGTELALCQRYFEKSYNDSVAPNTVNSFNSLVEIGSSSYSNGVVYNYVPFKVPKRTSPTVTLISLLGVSGKWEYGRSGASNTNATATATSTGEKSFNVRCDVGAAWVVAYLNGHYTASAEL
jgi:hypothetical protein